jgi:hypothetical protein
MKKQLSFVLILLISITIQAQEKNKEDEAQEKKDYTENVLTIDSTINSLYTVISGEKDEERDWDLFKFLFYPNAKLIASGRNKEGEVQVRYMKPEEYIKGSGKWLVENGFFEKEIHRIENTFGSISQVFSTYETFHSEKDKDPFMRGINSIQLFNDGKRWWIVNVYWSQETKKQPIPKKYLP